MTELEIKLLRAIKEMAGENLEHVVYYQKGATYIKTDKGSFMLRLNEYFPPDVTLDSI